MSTRANWNDAVIGEALDNADAFGPMARDLRGQSQRWAQEHGVQRVFRQLRGWFGRRTPVSIDRQRGGVGPGRNLRPDAQFANPDRRGRPTYIEVDTDRRRMQGHINARAAGVRSVFLLVDPATGALVEKHVYPAGSNTPTIRRARPGRGLTLTRRDVFDAFDA